MTPDLKLLVEKISMEIVMADRNDSGPLTDIMSMLGIIRDMPPDTDFNHPVISAAAAAMYSYAEKTAAQNDGSAYDILGRAVSALQSILDGNVMPEEALFPPELSVNQPPENPLRMFSAGMSSCRDIKPHEAPVSGVKPGAPEIICDAALLGDFISEASEHALSAEKNMLALEKENNNKEAVNSVFRAFHTLKSLAGFLGLGDIHVLVAETENLLSGIRKNEIPVNAYSIELLYDSVDILKRMIKNVTVSVKTGVKIAGEPELAAHAAALKNAANNKHAAPESANDCSPAEGERAAKDAGIWRFRETVKIDSSKLDRLIDTIGEIVIAESMINSESTAVLSASNDFLKNISHLNKTTKRLHELGLALRLVPLAPLMHKLERIIRDLAKTHNKKIRFTATGQETEIDRNVVEKIHDPLVHMLRNAVDHGLEQSPEERIKAGKPETAEICINASHRGGNVIIEVSDDGRGLDSKRIFDRGVENNLINHQAALTTAEINNLIFLPGFSTAESVTDTSGRGVGMDVVKRNVESLRGKIEIETQPGKGTKFIVSLPVTTAIIEAMVVTVDEDKYLLPTLSIVESVKAEQSKISTVKGEGRMINLRDRLIPVFSLKNLFSSCGSNDVKMDGKIIIIIEEDNSKAGIVVDNILEQQQIVVKNMSKGIRKTEGITGCTIMSDGRVGLILDAAEIMKLALQKGRDK